METVFINFKGLGIRASLNKTDFDPAKHKLWTAADEAALSAPLAPKPVAPVATTGTTPWAKPATTRKAKG